MKQAENEKTAATMKQPTDNKQVHLVVAGCKVKMNFPANTEATAINDIKRMMLGGVTRP